MADINIRFPNYLGNSIFSVSNITELRSLPIVKLDNNTNIIVDGLLAAGDGSGAFFVWSETSIAVDDGVKVIQPSAITSGAGRWVAVQQSNSLTYAPLSSPALTGVPTAPIAAPTTNSAQIATTAFVQSASTSRASLTAAQVRTLSTKVADRFDFRDMLGADLTGANSMTSTLNLALANAQSTGDILHMPLGDVVLDSTISLKSGMRVSGVGARTMFPDRLRGTGSWFHIAHSGVGFSVAEDGFQSNVVLEQFGMFWDQPAFATGWTPNDHDFAIQSTGARLLLRDLMLLNPTRAINQLSGSGQIEICRVKGQPFKVGVQIDSGVEGFTVNGLRWWPFWSNDSTYTRPYTLANRKGMYIRHCDNPYVNGYFDIFSQFPLFFGSHPNGVCNNGNFINPEFDVFGGTAISTELGANMVHATLIGGYSTGSDGSGHGLQMDGNDGILRFVAHRWQEINGRAALLNGGGNTLKVSSCEVSNWNKNNTGLQAFAGAITNRITIDGDVQRSGGNGASLVNSPVIAASEDYMTLTGLPVTTQTGTLTTATANCRVQRTAHRLTGRFSITVTTNGTGAGDIRVGLPVNAAAGLSFYSTGRNLSTGVPLQVIVNGSTAVIISASNTYPVASGQIIEFNVDYECVPL